MIFDINRLFLKDDKIILSKLYLVAKDNKIILIKELAVMLRDTKKYDWT